MLSYYNKEERLMRESIPTDIVGARSENSLLSNPTTMKEARIEMRDYFRDRQFILETLTPREAEVFTMYYGIDGEKPMTYEQIGKKYDVSRTRIGQMIAKILRKLRHPSRLNAYSVLTDKEIGYNPPNRDAGEEFGLREEFSFDKLQELRHKKLNAMEQARYDALSTEEHKADKILTTLLTIELLDFAKIMNIDIDMGKLTEITDRSYPTINILLATPKSVLIENGFNELIQKLESLGLHFYEEFEYVEDFNKKCYKSMMKVGLKNIGQLFPTKATIFSLTLEDLDLSVRTFTCLKRAGKDTVLDLISMSEDEYLHVRNLGKKSMEEILLKINSLGLSIRPEDVSVEKWISQYGNPVVVAKDKETEEVKINAELLEITIEEIDMSVRSFNCLKRAGKNTLGDIVVMSASELLRVRNLGGKSYKEVLEKIRSFGLEVRPEGIKREDWLGVLAQNAVNIENVRKLNEFETMLELEYEPHTALRGAGKYTINDLVSMTSADYAKIEDLTEEDVKVIVSKLEALGFGICPDGVEPQKWIEKLIKKPLVKKQTENQKKLNINEIPEEYRRTYAIGAGLLVEEEMKKGLISRVINSNKSKGVSEKPATPKVKYTQEQVNEMTDKQVLKAISEDISVIDCLETSFIVKYRKELTKMILADASLDVEKRFEILELVNEAKIDSLTQQ